MTEAEAEASDVPNEDDESLLVYHVLSRDSDGEEIERVWYATSPGHVVEQIEAAGDYQDETILRITNEYLPEPREGSIAALLERASKSYQAGWAGGEALLTGPSTVHLALAIPDALHPVEAVRRTISECVQIGFDSFTFAVVNDQDGEVYYVKGANILPQDDDKP